VVEKRAGHFVVAATFVSACVVAVEAVHRLMHPQALDHLGALAAAGAIGFVANEIAAQIRLRGGRRLNSPALIADGYHARAGGFASVAVLGSAATAAAGFKLGDPLIGLAISVVIVRITWRSIRTIRAVPGLPDDEHPEHHVHSSGDSEAAAPQARCRPLQRGSCMRLRCR
jgi:cation diffusion facilitator family transporter